MRAYQRRSRRKALLARLERIAFDAAHQVLVPDGMGGFIHIDHLLLTAARTCWCSTRAASPGLIFGGDQMSDWTVMGRGYRYTFDNPQPALYDRIAAVKATRRRRAGRGTAAVFECREIHQGHSEMGADARRHRSGISGGRSAASRHRRRIRRSIADAWSRLVAQLRPSPHVFTNL